MMRCVKIAVAVLLSVVGGALFAQSTTMYVTDTLRLGLHNAEDTSDRSFRTLESGQQMTVITRNRSYAQVELPDGTRGYVKTAYLVDEKPAKLIVEEMREQATSALAQLAAVQEEYSSSASRIQSLQNDLASALEQSSAAQAQAAAAIEERDRVVGQLAVYGFALPWPIALAGVVAAFLIGIFGGFWWLDQRSRKRHGGFRIY
jgi:uncharacterized protein YgiM (DUF1202 family)